MLEYRRFTLEEACRGAAAGWTFSSGWFPFQMSYWAWHCRRVDVVGRGSVEGIGSRETVSEVNIPVGAVDIEMDPDLVGAEGATVKTLPCDFMKQGQPPLTKQVRSGPGRAVVESQPGIDEPHSALVERCVDADGKGEPLGDRHGPHFPWTAVEVKGG